MVKTSLSVVNVLPHIYIYVLLCVPCAPGESIADTVDSSANSGKTVHCLSEMTKFRKKLMQLWFAFSGMNGYLINILKERQYLLAQSYVVQALPGIANTEVHSM